MASTDRCTTLKQHKKPTQIVAIIGLEGCTKVEVYASQTKSGSLALATLGNGSTNITPSTGTTFSYETAIPLATPAYYRKSYIKIYGDDATLREEDAEVIYNSKITDTQG